MLMQPTFETGVCYRNDACCFSSVVKQAIKDTMGSISRESGRMLSSGCCTTARFFLRFET